MFAPGQYELVDMGLGRKLERFGPYVLDRPCLAASDHSPRLSGEWQHAHARYERTGGDEGQWRFFAELPERWTIRHEPFALEVKLTPFGHVGVFPEQAANWDWIGERIRALRGAGSASASGRATGSASAAAGTIGSASADEPMRRPKVLNLFAYTGASTLAAAAAGAEVVHVDAAANIVAWARRNAELSGLAEAPIRWIVEDARKFVDREIRRGNKYDLVIADPPAFGHGPKGQQWNLRRDLDAFAAATLALGNLNSAANLITHHSDSVSAAAIRHSFGSAGIGDSTNAAAGEHVEVGDMRIPDRSGRLLHCGYFIRGCRG